MEELSRATEVEGEIKKRKDAVTTDDLWKLSGRQDDALTNANDDKRRTNDFVVKATTIIENARRPPCSVWNLACRWRRRNDL